MDSSDIPLEVVPRLSSYNMQNKNTYDDIGSKDANPFINLDLNYIQKIAIRALNFSEPTEIQKMTLLKFNENYEKYLNFIITSKAGSGKTFSYILCLLSKIDIKIKKLQVNQLTNI